MALRSRDSQPTSSEAVLIQLEEGTEIVLSWKELAELLPVVGSDLLGQHVTSGSKNPCDLLRTQLLMAIQNQLEAAIRKGEVEARCMDERDSLW